MSLLVRLPTNLKVARLLIVSFLVVVMFAPGQTVVYNKWTAIEYRPDVPSNRQYHSATLVVRPLDGHLFMLVFGGRSNTAWTEGGLRGMECPSLLKGSGDEVAKCCIGRAVNETWLFNIKHRYWLQVFALSAPPARLWHSAAPLASDEGIVVFGGHSLNETFNDESSDTLRYSLFNDVWVFTPSPRFGMKDHEIGSWRPALSAAGTPQPSERYGVSLQRIDDNRYFMFGGCVQMNGWKCSNATNDLWELSIATYGSDKDAWSAVWKEVQLTNDGSSPGPRWAHVGAFTSFRRRSMLVFGGHSGYDWTPYNDLYEYVFGNNSLHGYWKHLPPINTTSNRPFTQAAGAFNSDLDCLVVFLIFGETDTEDGQGLFLFCFSSSNISSSGWWSANLLPRAQNFEASQPFTFNLIGQSFLFYRWEQLIVYGGRTDIFTGEESSSLWSLLLTVGRKNLRPSVWTRIHANPSQPLQLAFHRCIATDDVMVVIGGRAIASRNFTDALQQKAVADSTFAWRLNTTERRWEPIEIAGGSSTAYLKRLHSNASFLVDFSVCQVGSQLLLFGGFIGCNIISCASGDVTNALTVMNTSTDTLWRVERVDEGNGALVWPSARRGHTAVMHKNNMYVFGGVQRTSNLGKKDVLHDLWQYNVLTRRWSDLTANLTNPGEHLKWPGPRFGHTAVALHGVIFVFGGSNGNSDVSKSEAFWSFDIQTRTWKNLAFDTPILPSPRFFHAATSIGDNAFIISGGCKQHVFQELRSIGCLYCGQRLLISESTWLYNAIHRRWEHLHYDHEAMSTLAGRTLDADARAMQSLVSLHRNGANEIWQFGGYSQCTGNTTEVSVMRMYPGCNKGYYSQDITHKVCEPCPLSTYAPLAGSTRCLPCPAYTGTITSGSDNLLNCTAACNRNLCHNRGHCHIVMSSDYTLEPTCTSCDFGYETNDNCEKPIVYYKVMGGIFGVLAAFIIAAASWKVYKQMVKHREQDKLLRTSRREICELTAAWQIDPSEVVMKKRIDLSSPGGFGEVWLAEYRDMKVAVKTLATAQLLLNPNAKDEMQNEMVLMRTLRHPNIVLFLGGGDLPDSKGAFIVMEYMAQGTLTSLLAKKTIHIDREQQLRFALDAARGMRFLHGLSPPRIHRDLKSGNLLISERWVVKVADFGTSRLLPCRSTSASMPTANQSMALDDCNDDDYDESFVQVSIEGVRARMSTLTSPLLQRQLYLTTHVGTILWKAPEMLRKKPYGTAADIYSFGIVLWEILTRQMPFDDQEFRNIFEIESLVVNGGRPAMPETCPPGYKLLMQSCWADDPGIRPTFAEIVLSLEKQLEQSRLPMEFEADLL